MAADQNLSRRLVKALAEEFPDSSHVALVSLATATDREVWEFAKANGYTIVSKDADFGQLAFLYGQPPKAIWLRVGNQATKPIVDLIRISLDAIARFDANRDESLLVLPDLGPTRPSPSS